MRKCGRRDENGDLVTSLVLWRAGVRLSFVSRISVRVKLRVQVVNQGSDAIDNEHGLGVWEQVRIRMGDAGLVANWIQGVHDRSHRI